MNLLSQRQAVAPKPNKRRPRSPETVEKFKATRLARKIERYRVAFAALGGSATTVQLANHMGYNPTSLAFNLGEMKEHVRKIGHRTAGSRSHVFVWEWIA